MMQTTQSGMEARHATTQPVGERSQAAEERDRLQILVGELLSENQKLRFKMAQLEEWAQSSEHGLANATRWAGMLF